MTRVIPTATSLVTSASQPIDLADRWCTELSRMSAASSGFVPLTLSLGATHPGRFRARAGSRGWSERQSSGRQERHCHHKGHLWPGAGGRSGVIGDPETPSELAWVCGSAIPARTASGTTTNVLWRLGRGPPMLSMTPDKSLRRNPFGGGRERSESSPSRLRRGRRPPGGRGFRGGGHRDTG